MEYNDEANEVGDLENIRVNDRTYMEIIKDVDSIVIVKSIEEAGGNQTKAAARLGMNRGTLRKKIGIHHQRIVEDPDEICSLFVKQ